MIPENIDIEELAGELENDTVAVGPLTGGRYPTLESDLIGAVEDAADGSFGTLGFVVLDSTPAVTADIRDIAQELLNETSLDTIVVRTPDSGAVVSDIHSRALLESAQHEMLGTVDHVEGVSLLVRDVTESGLFSVDWAQVSLWVGIVVLMVLIISAVFVQKNPIRN